MAKKSASAAFGGGVHHWARGRWGAFKGRNSPDDLEDDAGEIGEIPTSKRTRSTCLVLENKIVEEVGGHNKPKGEDRKISLSDNRKQKREEIDADALFPAGDKTTGEKPAGEKPVGLGSKLTNDKPTDKKPVGEKPNCERATGEKPVGEKTAEEKATEDNSGEIGWQNCGGDDKISW